MLFPLYHICLNIYFLLTSLYLHHPTDAPLFLLNWSKVISFSAGNSPSFLATHIEMLIYSKTSSAGLPAWLATLSSPDFLHGSWTLPVPCPTHWQCAPAISYGTMPAPGIWVMSERSGWDRRHPSKSSMKRKTNWLLSEFSHTLPLIIYPFISPFPSAVPSSLHIPAT